MYTQDSLRQSSYEGWVAWIGGSPAYTPGGTLIGYDGCVALLESIPRNTSLLSPGVGVKDREVRHEGRQTMDWKDLPHDKIVQLELYAFRDVYPNQPVISIMKQPNRDVRFIQFKRGGIALSTAKSKLIIPASETNNLPGQKRIGISSWVIGYWDRTVGQAEVWDIPAFGGKWPDKLELNGSNHPCWPKPLGFGLGPQVFGLKPEQVPPVPVSFALDS